MNQRILLILILINSSFFVFSQQDNHPRVVITTEQLVDNNNSFILSLNGKWEFYWKEFLNYEDFHDSTREKPLIVNVPAYWTDYRIQDASLSGEGYATFRKTILLPEGHPDVLGIKIPVFDDSYRLFINDLLVSEGGDPGKSEDNSLPGYNPGTIIFHVNCDSLDIIVHVSNYHHRRGGFWQSMTIGTRNKILKERDLYELLSYTSIGILLAFSFFFFFFFLFYQKNYISLFFSIALIGILLRLISTDTYAILLFNPGWQNLIRFEYTGSFIALTGGIWYFHSLFQSKRIRKISLFITALNLLAIILIVLTKTGTFSYTMFFFQPVAILLVVYYLIKSLINIRQGTPEKQMFSVAILIFTLALINDVLIANSKNALTENYITHFAVQFFVFVQALIIIRQWISSYREKERLNKEIEFINLNLEKLVKERTAELEQQNKKIYNQNKQIEKTNQELQAGMDFNRKLLSIIAHDLKSPVASLLQISDHMYKSKRDPDLKKIFHSFRELSDSAYNLIENLLYWGRSRGSKLNLIKKPVDGRNFLEEVVNFFSETAAQKNISLKTDVADLECILDRQIIMIIMRNLISNSIKFTPEGGEVIVSLKKTDTGEEIVCVVEDGGGGISAIDLQNLQKGIFPESSYGTSGEKGSGLGLPLCFELAELHDGKIEIESEEGKGTTVSLFLPCK